MSNRGIAVITGASSGIGADFARSLAAQGYDLLLVARRADRLTEVGASLKSEFGVTVENWVCDLADSIDLVRLERRLEDQPVAILVNNAGAGCLGPTETTGADAQEALIRLNVIALVRLSLAALAGFRRAGSGTLVNISSVIAYAPSAAGASYSGSKAFVLNFTRSLQMEYANSDIRIQAILPGPIRTEFFSSQGLSDSIFPDTAYITAEKLVDAALAGLRQGEKVTIPTLASSVIWDNMESSRQIFLGEVLNGKVAERYSSE